MKSLARYAATNAITRTMLSELLTKEDFEGMIRSESLQGAWLTLRKTSYGDWIPQDAPTTILGIEKILREATANRFKRSMHALRGKPREVGTLLLSRWELDNLEFALRLWHSRDTSLQAFLTFPTPVNDIAVYDVVQAETLEEIALILRHSPYFEPLSASVQVYKAKRSIFVVEVALERDYYARLLQATRELGGSDAAQAEKIVSAEIDMLNLSWLTRLVEYYDVKPSSFHEFMIPGPSETSRRLADPRLTSEDLKEIRSRFLTESLRKEGKALPQLDMIALMESMVGEMAVDVARRSLAGYPFSIGCVFAFYLLKRVELKNLCAVFAGKSVDTAESEIFGRLHGLR